MSTSGEFQMAGAEHTSRDAFDFDRCSMALASLPGLCWSADVAAQVVAVLLSTDEPELIIERMRSMAAVGQRDPLRLVAAARCAPRCMFCSSLDCTGCTEGLQALSLLKQGRR